MTNHDNSSKPHKESNEDKGNQDSFKNKEPVKKLNEQPESPVKEQK